MKEKKHYFFLITCNDEIFVAAKNVHKGMYTFMVKKSELASMAFGC